MLHNLSEDHHFGCFLHNSFTWLVNCWLVWNSNFLVVPGSGQCSPLPPGSSPLPPCCSRKWTFAIFWSKFCLQVQSFCKVSVRVLPFSKPQAFQKEGIFSALKCVCRNKDVMYFWKLGSLLLDRFLVWQRANFSGSSWFLPVQPTADITESWVAPCGGSSGVPYFSANDLAGLFLCLHLELFFRVTFLMQCNVFAVLMLHRVIAFWFQLHFFSHAAAC